MKYERLLIVTLLLAATVVLSFFVPPFVAALLIPAAAIGVVFSSNPRVLLFGSLAVLSVAPLLRTVVPIGPVKFLDEVVIVSLFGVFLGHVAFHRMSFREAGTFGKIALAMLGWAALTWVINRGSPRGAFQCFVSYFSFIPVYILSLRYLKISDFKGFLVGTMVFLWINVALSIGWLYEFNPLPLPPGIKGIDRGVGTLAGCNFVAYFCAMFFFLLLSVLIHKVTSAAVKKWAGLTMVVLFAMLYLAYTNHAYMFLAAAFIPYAFFSGLWKRRAILFVGLGITVAVMAAFTFSDVWKTYFSKDNIEFRMEMLSKSAKVQIMGDLLVDNYHSMPFTWFVGNGPGNGMGPIGKNNTTPFALKMLLPYYRAGAMEMKTTMQMGSITGNTTSAVFTLWGDFGLIGTGVFVSFYLWLMFRCISVIKHENVNSSRRAIAEFLVGAIPFFIVVNIVIDVFLIKSFAVWVWMWAALMNLPDETTRRRQIA